MSNALFRPELPSEVSKLSLPSTLYINASQVSAFCQRHAYKTRDDVFLDVVQNRRNADLLAKVEHALDEEEILYKPIVRALDIQVGSQTATIAVKNLVTRRDHDNVKDVKKSQAVKRMIETAPVATQEEIKTLHEKRPRTSTVAQEVIRNTRSSEACQRVVSTEVLTDQVVRKADESVRKSVAEVVKRRELDTTSTASLKAVVASQWVKDRGTVLEPGVVNSLAKEISPEEDLKTQKYNEIHVVVGKTTVVIPCMMDACVCRKDSSYKVETVYEVKNRKNRFFTPQYDLDQLCVYVVASDAAQGVLVEKLQGETRHSLTMTLGEAHERWNLYLLPSLIQSVIDLDTSIAHCREMPHAKVWDRLHVRTL